MRISIGHFKKLSEKQSTIHLITDVSELKPIIGIGPSLKVIKAEFENKAELVPFIGVVRNYVVKLNPDGDQSKMLEDARKKGYLAAKIISGTKLKKIAVKAEFAKNDELFKAFVEGLLLASYRFNKYKSGESEIVLAELLLPTNTDWSAELQHLIDAVFITRDLVNEPVSYLTAVQLSKEIEKVGEECGFSVKVLDKKQIEALKMGGLLSINRGSIDPPTFSILEYKPKIAKNKKPIVLVGKGVVFDTGGLSLKPTPNSMDLMKSDMAGAGAVVGIFAAISKNKLPLHVVGLIPSTDNRPGVNAIAPGDVVTMHDKTTVEVLNTDAEGRMILADALSFAKQYKPGIVFDFATLTGAAVRAVGHRTTAYNSTANNKYNELIEQCGLEVYERLINFPLWEDYAEQIKSDIADLKNIGGPLAGSITAAKFLEHFTDYPWMHLDIAGPAFQQMEDSYRGKNGTGVGVRLMYAFLKRYKEI